MLSQLLTSLSPIRGALPILFDAALKGAILVAIAAAAAYLLRKRSAASRHAAWTAAVIGHLAIPALVLLLPAWTMPVLPAASWMRADASPAGTQAPIPAANAKGSIDEGKAAPTAIATDAKTSMIAPDPAPPIAPVNERPAIIQIVAAIWFAGALLVLLRLAFGTWRVGQLARDGARVEDGVWLSLTQRLANTLGVTRPLILLRGERLAVPVTWGIVYPAVLLPQDADTWSEERRRFVLVHEMAHVKRFDALTQLLAQISVAVFWFDPLVWIAAHQMRVEREHACDDYVLRDGTAPSLYAGELLEMVRSIGTPSHDQAAPAFAALAMARRSEFEGRMLAILDPRLDRHTLTRRGTLMTAVILALLTLPLAALRPYQQPATTAAAAAAETLPESFKVSIIDAPALQGSPTSTGLAVSPATPAKAAQTASTVSKARWSCEAYPTGTELYGTSSHGTSTHISSHDDGENQVHEYLVSEPGRCTEAAVLGKALFSPDETRIAQLAPGGFARFRERTRAFDRAVSITPVGDGSLNYSALVDGRPVPFDAAMQSWLSRLLPEVLREIGINVPARVARLRAEGGVPRVLQSIGEIHSSGSKRTHYEELIKNGPTLSGADAERVAQQVARDLTSSGDLSAVLQMLPRSVLQNPTSRKAIAGALSQIQSSGDKANTLQILAPNADRELLLLLAQAAETLPSSGDKANFLITTAAEYLNPANESLRTAYFRAVATVQSSGDMANVLISAMPYSHASPAVALEVIEKSKGLTSSGDAANVLIELVSQGVLQPGTAQATLAVIRRTLTMASSGDRANVLISLSGRGLLANSEVKDAFIKAAMALPSDGDRANVLAAAARQ
jgi:beta-lactamase regulating signal transducer with metallopeptidase domain